MRTFLRVLPFLLLASGAHAQNNPVRIDLVPWANVADSITKIASCGDDRLFVVRRQGVIKIVTDSMEVTQRPFLNIEAQVNHVGHEQGLLGLAFDPDYLNNGYFYTYYIAGSDAGASVISRWHVSNDPDSADMASEEIIYTYPQPYTNHNGGDITFGPDGLLYIPFGDGGDAGDPQNHAQNLSDPLGDIIRIDVSDEDTTYTIPPSNPWVNTMDTLPEIWASGLRNPWRISFDSEEGDLWIGDVGQSAWEEVDYWEAGDNSGPNFGWRCYEGPQEYNAIDCLAEDAYVQPVAAHINDGNFSDWCAVIGGYVYHGTMWPHLEGLFIYADYCKPEFWALREGEEETFIDEMVREDTFFPAWNTFGQDNAGELYIGNEAGEVYKIIDKCPMDAPLLTFDGSDLMSSAADGYMWFIDDVEILGATGQMYNPMENGVYYVLADFGNGCLLASDTVQVMTVSVSEMQRPFVTLEPNPANTTITLRWAGSNVHQLRLTDLQGRLIRTGSVNGNTRYTMDVSSVENGEYMIDLRNAQGATIRTERIVVMH